MMHVSWMFYGLCLGMAAAGWLLIQRREAAGALSCRVRELCGQAEGRGRAFLRRKNWKDLFFVKFFWSFWLEQRRREMEWEMGEAISYLRNAVAMGRGDSMSAGLILEELADLQGQLSPVYLKMLHYLRLNEKEKMIRVLSTESDSGMAADFARLLLQWEELPPHMLVEALESYQKNIREVRETRQKKQDEVVSDLIYLPVIMNVMLVLINFIYVAYFIEQRETLLTMFG